MPCKTPDFWYKNKGLVSTLLMPVAWAYQAAHKILQSAKPAPYKSSLPVICVGNAIAGGGGKTPTAIALVHLIRKAGIFKNPVFITRGYGGNITGPVLVSETHTAGDIGDEALLLANHAPTIVSINRAEGAKLAEKNQFDIIIMDDGFLNKDLNKDISFLVIDRQIDFGNGRTIPAGPLREPLKDILPKTNAVICIGRPLQSEKPVFTAQLKAADIAGKNQNFIAFTGIAWPEKFKTTLETENIHIIGWHEFADHHSFSQAELKKLKEEAEQKQAALITTEKDYVRLPDDFAVNVETLPVEILFEDQDALVSFLRDTLKSAP
jgi:tetraacyldisaccharide 4'-kinase